MSLINSEKVKGDGERVTYWNLVRSYILLHHKDEDVIFYVYGIGDDMDFLHFTHIKRIPKDANWDEEVLKIKHKVEDLEEIDEDLEENQKIDVLMIRYKDGKFLNNKV